MTDGRRLLSRWSTILSSFLRLFITAFCGALYVYSIMHFLSVSHPALNQEVTVPLLFRKLGIASQETDGRITRRSLDMLTNPSPGLS